MSRNPILIGVGIGAGTILVLGIVFFTGLMIGRMGAEVLPPPPIAGEIENRHGILGTVTQVNRDEQSFEIVSANNEPLTVEVGPGTSVRVGKQPGTFRDLTEGTSVIVLGSMKQDQYVARLVVIQLRKGPQR